MDASRFVGTWRLVSMELRDAAGQVSYPFGRNALGYIMYGPGKSEAVTKGKVT